MKKALFVVLLSILSSFVYAQDAKKIVTWKYNVKKGSTDKMYELHMTATIQSGWHLYSQTQPPEAIAIPTSFVIKSNPLLVYEGKIMEVGKIEHFHDKQLDIRADQYSGTVTFVQKVRMKVKAKTTVSGTIEFQVCTDERCLPPAEEKFTISISSL